VINNELPVYLYDPKREEWNVMKDEDIELAKKKQKAAMSTFLMSKKIGVLITTKYGQQRIQMSMKLKEKYPDKEFFLLVVRQPRLEFTRGLSFLGVFCEYHVSTHRLGRYEQAEKASLRYRRTRFRVVVNEKSPAERFLG
jgi:diphthamide biosynthesis enzyme Dph1/Dph2-like protein